MSLVLSLNIYLNRLLMILPSSAFLIILSDLVDSASKVKGLGGHISVIDVFNADDPEVAANPGAFESTRVGTIHLDSVVHIRIMYYVLCDVM